MVGIEKECFISPCRIFSYELYRRKRHIVVCRRDAYRNRCYQKYQRQQQNCKAQILFFSHISVKKVAGGHKVAARSC